MLSQNHLHSIFGFLFPLVLELSGPVCVFTLKASPSCGLPEVHCGGVVQVLFVVEDELDVALCCTQSGSLNDLNIS